MWPIYKLKLYPALEKNEAMSFVEKQTQLESTQLREMCQTQGQIRGFSFVDHRFYIDT